MDTETITYTLISAVQGDRMPEGAVEISDPDCHISWGDLPKDAQAWASSQGYGDDGELLYVVRGQPTLEGWTTYAVDVPAVRIASRFPGRTGPLYHLLEEVMDRFDMRRQDAEAAIHAILDLLIAIDGAKVVLGEEPVRPELEKYNPYDLDRHVWIYIRPTDAEVIVEAIAESRRYM